MENFICTTCGTQFKESKEPLEVCPICSDERQYVHPNGQQWTTLDALRKKHKITIQKKEKALYGIGMSPEFGIGQRALLIRTPQGNVLWDCISLVDETIVDIIQAWGGLHAIAISHPHYYTSMVEWSKAFGDIPICLHEKDKKWVQRPNDRITFWNSSSKPLFDNVELHHIGGHFEGGTILHWKDGAMGKGALLTGDILQVVPDRRHISFMYSYPNHIPLNRSAIERITDILKPLDFDRIYGAWWDQNIQNNGKKAVQDSAERYIAALS